MFNDMMSMSPSTMEMVAHNTVVKNIMTLKLIGNEAADRVLITCRTVPACERGRCRASD
ncbi:hypothetical protein PI124_g21113 [Phytophthora idaei]|nr:hypothetical protein PI125_g15471 [Phytophthora idaei]KAG3141621.1 hypothetical protein PI126_g15429 [Phytophthora idaei]KAG3233823.1 hypothetical protein PI124_g21113 [Phytophthora idaei]